MEQTSKQGFFSSTRIAFIAIFATLAGILYVLNFPISVAFPSFLSFNFSDVPVLIGTFALGPVSGVVIIVIKILIKLVIQGTTTVFVGELADLLIGCAFAVPAGIIYKRHRTFKGALVAMLVGMLSSVVIAIIANWLILVPFYISFFFNGSWEPLIGMMTPLFPSCTKENFYNFYLWVSVLPFNVLRCLVAILITLPVYKHISKLINRLNDKISPKQGEDGQRTKKINLGVVIAGIVVVVLLVVFALLRCFVFKDL